MRTCTSTMILVLLVTFTVVYPAAAYYWYPIEDVETPHVQELGGWAVAEHVRQRHDGLKFGKVTSGELQQVDGVKYHLLIDALNRGGQHGRYEAVLIEERSSTRRLISFGPVI
uniref:Uncharacterized protein n=1 Tax=Avena sativa TaxID=4498 RepID=A0ACD6A2V1_AVESA